MVFDMPAIKDAIELTDEEHALFQELLDASKQASGGCRALHRNLWRVLELEEGGSAGACAAVFRRRAEWLPMPLRRRQVPQVVHKRTPTR